MARRMLRLWLALLALGALCAMCGADRGGYWPSYGGRGGYGVARGTSYHAGGVAGVDTIRVMSRHSTYPNTGAIAADYFNAADTTGVLNSAADGTTVMWGWVRENQATTVQASASANSDYENWIRQFGNSTEDNRDVTGDVNERYFFLWFSANGFKRGQKVESAYVVFNAPLGGATLGANTYFAARLDTIAKDYRIIANNTANGTHGSNNDVGRFDASWTHLDAENSLTWDPVLNARDDYHDFGPRSGNQIAPGTYAGGHPFRLDVTDAVQQRLDDPRADLTKGFLFVMYGSAASAVSIAITAGNQVASVTGAKGNPLFYATVTTKRGAKPWGMNGVPVCMTFDGNYPSQVPLYRALKDSGLVFDAAVVGYNFDVSAPVYDWPDSLLALHPGTVNILNHSKTTASLGSLTGAAIDPEIARTWIDTEFALSNYDTTSVVDWVWIGGVGTPYRSMETASRLMDFNYRTSRSAGFDWLAGQTAMHHDTRLAWHGYVNRYLIHSLKLENVFETSSAEASDAEVLERLTDLIDNYYTRYGRAALVMHGHTYDQGNSDYLSEAGMRKLIGLTRRLNSCEIMGYDEAIDRRMAGATFLAPGSMMEWVSAGSYTQVMRGIGADSNQIQAMAAQQDSVYEAGSDPNVLEMWLAPK